VMLGQHQGPIASTDPTWLDYHCLSLDLHHCDLEKELAQVAQYQIIVASTVGLVAVVFGGESSSLD
jgi:hypothetical protein